MVAHRSNSVVLTIAGSDSGGGAGIQADLKTFHTLGVFGTTALTCITAQNPDHISAIQAIQPRIVAHQLDRIFEAFDVRAAKTGLLYNAGIIETVAGNLRRRKFRPLVVDPVMLATSGALLLKKDAINVLRRQLLPLATVVTPNLAEAELLSRTRITTVAQLREAARHLANKFGVAFLIKGGHLPESRRAVDVLCTGRQVFEFSAQTIPGIKTHGTGCTLSAAIAGNLALGYDLPDAVARAKRFVTHAIRYAIQLGKYRALRV